jgi:hypothetical protein
VGYCFYETRRQQRYRLDDVLGADSLSFSLMIKH